jgi:hypothetical protein
VRFYSASIVRLLEDHVLKGHLRSYAQHNDDNTWEAWSKDDANRA